MGLFLWIHGWVRVRYTSADIAGVLSVLEKKQITVFDVAALDELSVEFSVQRRDIKLLHNLSVKRGERLDMLRHRGLYWHLNSAIKRPLLLFGILMLLFIGVMLPQRILFIQVDGSNRISERRILEAAEQAGLEFGTRRREIRSEQIKNILLELIPELKWAGVNTYGSRAVITVRERDDSEQTEEIYPVRHIIASRDGIITSCTVTNGCASCTVGQAVKMGDILISGYTDCGIAIRADAADGQIMAETNRNLTVLTPSNCHARLNTALSQVRYSLILGKKRINFYKGSGISGGTCVKMSTEYVLGLPGGFRLPVIVVKERILDSEAVISKAEACEELLISFAATYIGEQMVSGSVISKVENLSEADGRFILEGKYACTEDIGMVYNEKIGDLHGKTNGEDRERRPGG